MLVNQQDRSDDDFAARAQAILAQLDRIPDRVDAFDPLEWDEHGLPR
jgi:antitoxin VapB